jgi:hypothetical protein
VELYFQPSQSPDCNICDLSFFPAIQSRYFKIENIKNIKDIIEAVKLSFHQYEVNKLNRAFLSLMMNYNCILEFNGDNNYKMPHMKKAILERKGILPDSILVYRNYDDDESSDDDDSNDDDNDNDVKSFDSDHSVGIDDEVEWLIDDLEHDPEFMNGIDMNGTTMGVITENENEKN